MRQLVIFRASSFEKLPPSTLSSSLLHTHTHTNRRILWTDAIWWHLCVSPMDGPNKKISSKKKKMLQPHTKEKEKRISSTQLGVSDDEAGDRYTSSPLPFFSFLSLSFTFDLLLLLVYPEGRSFFRPTRSIKDETFFLLTSKKN